MLFGTGTPKYHGGGGMKKKKKRYHLKLLKIVQNIKNIDIHEDSIKKTMNFIYLA